MQGFKIVAGQEDAEHDLAVLVDQDEALAYLDDYNKKLWKSILDESELVQNPSGDKLDHYKELDVYLDGLGGLERLRSMSWVENEYRQQRACSHLITVYLPGEWVA